MKRTLVALLVFAAFFCGQLAAQNAPSADHELWTAYGPSGELVAEIDEVGGDTITLTGFGEGAPDGTYTWSEPEGAYTREGSGTLEFLANGSFSFTGGDGGVVILPG